MVRTKYYNPSIEKATNQVISDLMGEIDYLKSLEVTLDSSWDQEIYLKYKKDKEIIKQILSLRKNAQSILKELLDRYYKYGEKMVYLVKNPEF